MGEKEGYEIGGGQTEDLVATAWDENASNWTTQVRAGRDVFREVLNNPCFFDLFLPDLRGYQVLDLGCGEGHNTRLLARRGAHMTGVDISGRLIDAAVSAEAADPLGIQYHVCSFTTLNMFCDSTFDAAISTMALMNSPHLEKAIVAVYNVLHTGGTFFFSVLHPCFWTRNSKWLKNKDGQTQGMLVTEYWEHKEYIENSRFSFVSDTAAQFFSIPRFAYRLEDYINGLSEAGFHITQMLEPRPTAEMAAAHPALLGPLRQHVPLFLYLASIRT